MADRGDRTALYDDQGMLVLVFSLELDHRTARRSRAEHVWRPADVCTTAAAEAVLRGLSGHSLCLFDAEFVAELTRRGATHLRHLHVMSRPLTSLPGVPAVDGLEIEALSADQLAFHAECLGEINLRAYPVGHPDYEYETVATTTNEIRRIGRGEVVGPYRAESTVARFGGEIVGACLICDHDGVPPMGGPWITEVFRDPKTPVRRVGTALITTALAHCHAAGLPALSLSVTHGNTNAFALYRSLGFIDRAERWTVAIP